jgi:hypothetical protein
MEWFKAALNWLSSTAWPLSVVFIVLFFRKELKMLLASLGGLAKRAMTERFDITIGEKFKVSFGETIKRVEEEFQRLPEPGTGQSLPPPKPSGNDVPPPPSSGLIHDAPPGSHPPPKHPAPLPRSYYLERLSRLAEISPRGAILEAWKEVELTIEEIATYEGLSAIFKTVEGSHEKGVGQIQRISLSPEAQARQLVELKHIDGETFGIFEELRQLRNQVSHANLQPSVEQAKHYVQLALDLTDRIRFLVWGLPPPNSVKAEGITKSSSLPK